MLSSLQLISPIDGRYQSKTSVLQEYFCELALQKYRIFVEIEYFIALCKTKLQPLPKLSDKQIENLRGIHQNFSLKEGEYIKNIEKTTNHDVKAVEYFLKEKLENTDLKNMQEFIHFGLTSQDINNTATPLMMKDAVNNILLPKIKDVIGKLYTLALEWKDISMLARTHGQPASPTTLGKEIAVFAERLRIQYQKLHSIKLTAKFGGATGNFNAHHVAYPEHDWEKFGRNFVKKTLGLKYSFPTTQIDHYDSIAEWSQNIIRINTILIDFNRDMWRYISDEYFGQKTIKGEIGSSAMPHKVNPIDFENSEGNLGISTALLEHFATKLPISRLQRDLTDSTVLRNIGVPVAHTFIALESSLKGISKLELREKNIGQELESNWAVVAEAIQTILRREMYPKPYEALKELTRGKTHITKEVIHEFVDMLEVSSEVKSELKQITPHSYTGV